MVTQTITENLTTTNATPTTIKVSDENNPFVLGQQFSVFVHANEPATADQQLWAVRVVTGAAGSLSSANMHSQTGDAGGSGWGLEIVDIGTGIEIEVTGEASHTINWSLCLIQSNID